MATRDLKVTTDTGSSTVVINASATPTNITLSNIFAEGRTVLSGTGGSQVANVVFTGIPGSNSRKSKCLATDYTMESSLTYPLHNDYNAQMNLTPLYTVTIITGYNSGADAKLVFTDSSGKVFEIWISASASSPVFRGVRSGNYKIVVTRGSSTLLNTTGTIAMVSSDSVQLNHPVD